MWTTPPFDLRKLDPAMKLKVLVGDSDEAVGNTGAAELLDRLLAFGFPQQNIQGSVVHSTPDLVADHFAPLDTGPDARRLFWEPGNQIVNTARGG